MRREDCVRVMQAMLPRVGLQWAGYRRVHRRACKRLGKRITELGLDGADAYARRLEDDPSELALFDALVRMPISRLYRDRAVWDALRAEVLPELASRATAGGAVRAWSAGCASGEEPWTLAIAWALDRGGTPPLELVATDAEETLVARARTACFREGSLKEVPREWLDAAFERRGELRCVRDALRTGVTFDVQDLRRTQPDGPFDLVLCRNVAFTYFDEERQREAAARIAERLRPGGWLVVGRRETLPAGTADFERHPRVPELLRRTEQSTSPPAHRADR